MDDRRVGRALRLLRRRKGWRQVDLAMKAGVSQPLVSKVESGRWSTTSVDTLRMLFAAVGADLACLVRYRGGELDRLLDERHAATAGVVAAMLRRWRWTVLAEVSFNHYGDRGSVDLLAFHPASRTALVVEVKTEITSAEETLRRLDVKARLAFGLVHERLGERPARVVRLLAVSDSTANRTRLRRLEPLVGSAFPLRGGELRRWLADPGPATGALLFVRLARDSTAGNGTHGIRRLRQSAQAPSAVTQACGPQRTGCHPAPARPAGTCEHGER